jgi:hypothetical protein
MVWTWGGYLSTSTFVDPQLGWQLKLVEQANGLRRANAV